MAFPSCEIAPLWFPSLLGKVCHSFFTTMVVNELGFINLKFKLMFLHLKVTLDSWQMCY